MRFFKGMIFTLVILMTPLASFGGAKQEQVKSSKGMVFEGKMSLQQRKVASKIAAAIRSGNIERVRKFVKDNEDANRVLSFWAGQDQLSNLKFRVRPWNNGFILAEAKTGVSSCDVVKSEGRFIIGDCIFNDGY